jgi:hypothetical protein
MAQQRTIAAITFMLIMLLFIIPGESTSEGSKIVPLWGPYLTAVSETSITINWRTEDATNGAVYYATAAYFDDWGLYNNVIADSEKEFHQVELNGLIPDTAYNYRLSIGSDFTADYRFTTLGSEAFTFIVYGDTQEQLPMFTQLERHKLIADRIATEKDVSFILHAGDLVGDVNNPEEWNRFFEAARSALAEIPIFPVLGNHERNSTIYYDTFGVKQWYSFKCSDAHFALLDSNMFITNQAEWLLEDFNNEATWKFVVFHHPPYSSTSSHWGGWLNLRTAWEPVFMDKGVNAVFNGHVHAYERYYQNNIHYTVLGIGGAPSYTLAEEKIDGYRNSLENMLGYAKITVNGNKAFMEIIKVADISDGEISYTYPLNTVAERIALTSESSSIASLTATANLEIPIVGIELDNNSIDYGDVFPGANSAIKTVGITNIGNVACDVTLAAVGADNIAQAFYEQSLHIKDGLYCINRVIASIEVNGNEYVNTQLKVPLSWSELGKQDATFIFWSEAS